MPAPTPFLAEFVTQALTELSNKPLRQIQLETAMVWYGRAVAAAMLNKQADAIEYAHEAIEHAALSGDVALLRAIRAGLQSHAIAA